MFSLHIIVLPAFAVSGLRIMTFDYRDAGPYLSCSDTALKLTVRYHCCSLKEPRQETTECQYDTPSAIYWAPFMSICQNHSLVRSNCTPYRLLPNLQSCIGFARKSWLYATAMFQMSLIELYSSPCWMKWVIYGISIRRACNILHLSSSRVLNM